LSKNPRFIVIDEVEFLNVNSANALLQILEEPSENNFFLLTNNQQVDLIETISSRCLKSNIFLNQVQRKKVINYFVEDKKTNFLIDVTLDLTPGLLLKYNNLYKKYKIEHNENIYLKVNKLLNAYKKTKDKALVNMVVFFIDNFFFQLIKNDVNKIDILFILKNKILKKINDFIIYNLNISLVLNFIELKLKNAQQ
jgi:DNA polymerase III delta prime subunit